MKEIVAELTHLARRSPEISQRSRRVRARVDLQLREPALERAEARDPARRAPGGAARLATSAPPLASTAGKIELETPGDGDEEKVIERLVQRAVLNVFNRHFSAGRVRRAGGGLRPRADVGGRRGDAVRRLRAPGRRGGRLRAAMTQLGAAGHPARVAAAVEFVLEGLHLNRKLNKDRGAGRARGTRREEPLLALGRLPALPDFDADDLLAAMADDLSPTAICGARSSGSSTRASARGTGEQMPGLQDLLEQLRRQRQSTSTATTWAPSSTTSRRSSRTSSRPSARASSGASRARGSRPRTATPEAEAHARSSSGSPPSGAQPSTRLPKDPGGPCGACRTTSSSIPRPQKFQELMLRLQQQMTQSLFGQLQQALQGMSAQDMRRACARCCDDLNRMLREQAEGGEPDFQAFMEKWGQMFPGAQSLDQLLEQMAQQSAQMQSLLESMSPEQRRELEEHDAGDAR